MLQRYFNYLQVDRTFLLLVFIFSYFLVISNRVRAGMLSWYTFTPEGPLANFLAALVIFSLVRFWLNRLQTKPQSSAGWPQYLSIAAITLLCYLLFTNGVGLLIASLFGNVARNFNTETLLHSNVNHLVDSVLYAGIYLAYYHYQQAQRYRQQVADYNEQLAQLKIQQLKAQLNPHFVFNSLNTLDELIAVDGRQASDYLNAFAQLYRLSLQHAELQLVPLSQELEFARQYFRLMQQRLGEGYQLTITNEPLAPGYLLPPFSLQLLLENALLHNSGSLEVSITLQHDYLQVSNPLQPKPHKALGNGVGLANLSKQWLFLTGKNIDINQDGQQFTVRLPLIREQSHV
ncbi:sensor histidine kinase [Arsukibacterium indicum]|uniref:Histidine kinase n=1 Tax=Arsukibacterium indicum TaxID=2848612 RepID=A0ABS6MNF8_9GAMM|nr:histidine kinase [Arsukibacterium indicum]MBV2130343.1 histidine kinase [Arsukibacterium indicum]